MLNGHRRVLLVAAEKCKAKQEDKKTTTRHREVQTTNGHFYACIFFQVIALAH